MKPLLALFAPGALIATALAADPQWVTYEGQDGPGKGKHIVFLAGDEEYRSEEALPHLARILSRQHGFKSTVVFSLNPDTGAIDPNTKNNQPGIEALGSADLCVTALRFRAWPDQQMKHFADYYLAGKPIVALRTSTHAFQLPAESSYKQFNDFGKNVLGERWVSHWGKHKSEATRGVIQPAAKDHPILRGVEEIFGNTDVYEAYPPADAKILLRGEVVKGMKPGDPPADYRKKRATDKQEQGVNDPMMPIAWTREHRNEAGKTNRIFTTTMGSSTDLQSEGLRRLLVNAAYWAIGLEEKIPAKAKVAFVGDFEPLMYGFNGYKKGVKPADWALAQ
ncbi:MAG: ThuA domain-containing protein [Verrucomicrobiota bacterium]|nr:ThuA domain-containing protein [Verrucomicrobiota bacterium]